MILIYCCFIVVGIGWHTRFQFKEPVYVSIGVFLRRGGQAHHDRIKILENCPVFLKNTSVALVHDDQVKMRRCEQPQAILALYIINGVQHRRIGRKHDPGVPVILIGAKVAQ